MSNTMPMPGTIGGAKLVFKDQPKMQEYKVEITVTQRFGVDAESMDQAAEKALEFFRTMPKGWSKGDDVYWEDTEIVKKTVSTTTSELAG